MKVTECLLCVTHCVKCIRCTMLCLQHNNSMWQKVITILIVYQQKSKLRFSVMTGIDWASLIAQLVKNSLARQETLVGFLGREDPLEKGKTTHSSILGVPWWLSWERICLQCRRPGFSPWIGKIPWRRERLPTPVFWPGEFHRLYSPWGHKELDTTG